MDRVYVSDAEQVYLTEVERGGASVMEIYWWGE